MYVCVCTMLVYCLYPAVLQQYSRHKQTFFSFRRRGWILKILSFFMFGTNFKQQNINFLVVYFFLFLVMTLVVAVDFKEDEGWGKGEWGEEIAEKKNFKRITSVEHKQTVGCLIKVFSYNFLCISHFVKTTLNDIYLSYQFWSKWAWQTPDRFIINEFCCEVSLLLLVRLPTICIFEKFMLKVLINQSWSKIETISYQFQLYWRIRNLCAWYTK